MASIDREKAKRWAQVLRRPELVVKPQRWPYHPTVLLSFPSYYPTINDSDRYDGTLVIQAHAVLARHGYYFWGMCV